MSTPSVLDHLWNSAQPALGHFDPTRISKLPEPARRYLRHAVAPGAPLASAVRIRMHGQIKLKRWYPFSAEEVIRWNRGMIWRATVRMHAIKVEGGDALIDARGASRWKLFGIVPIINASGPDITRSAAGRVNIESLWLASVLSGNDISWTASDVSRPHARFTAHNETAEIDYTIDESGRLATVNMPRWGNPDSRDFRYVDCGGLAEQEGTFSGYTIPSRMRVGWHFGTSRFESEGEFFRVTIDDAIYK